MRLTLRTMLAYLDDILDPTDAEELGQKIEESDFAAGLVHRLRSSTRRLRLGAPNLQGKGMGLDPNTVAEYLDNVLPPDRVPDLEKVCLESDVHLAEVACCHQILTLVLGEAAEFDPSLRDRMYRIGAPDSDRAEGLQSTKSDGTAEPPVQDSRAVGQAVEAPPTPLAPPVQTVASKESGTPQIPAYLKAGQGSKLKPLAITLGLAFLISAVALRLMGPFDREHPMMRLFGASESTEVAEVPSLEANTDATVSGQGTPDANAETTVADATQASEKDGTARSKIADATPKVEPDEIGEGASPKEPVAESDNPGSEVTPIDDASQPPDPPKVTEGDAAPPTEMAKVDTDVAFPPTEPVTTGKPPGVKETPGEATDGGAEDPVPAPQVEVGHVKLSDQHFLVRLDPESSEWLRLPGRTKLLANDSLRVLPTYRPEIVLAPGVQVVFAGPTSARPLPPNAQGEPGLFVAFGRAFIGTAGVAGARIHLDLGGRRGVATFVDATSEMAVEVRRYLLPGTHPEREAAQTVVRLFPTIGRIDWQEADAPAAVPIDAGQVRTIIDETAQTIAAGELPAWMQQEDLRDVDRLASTTLVASLPPNRPITLSLRERTEDRKSEVRSLASRCLAYLGSYDALVKEFSDARQRSYWASEFDALRAAISRNPESALQVRETLEASCGDDAADLYRVISGYSPQQLQEGDAAKLVELLDHGSLNVRVFAYESLRRITNKTLMYRPETTDIRRRSSVQDWREQLENGAIIYVVLPGPLSGGF